MIARLFDGRLFHVVHALAETLDSTVVPLLSPAEAARLTALRTAVLTDVLPAGCNTGAAPATSSTPSTPSAPSIAADEAGSERKAAAAPASAPEPGPMLAPTHAADATAAALALDVLQEFCGVENAVVEAALQDGYGSFDIIFEQISRAFFSAMPPHAPRVMLYLVPMLVGY